MSSCEQFEWAVLDETLPRPEGHEAHLAGCEGCRALAAGHRGALRLKGTTSLAPTRRRPMAEVQRRAGIVAGLVLALGGGVGWYHLEVSPPAPAPVGVEFAAQPVEEPGDLLALAALQATVTADLARDPREDPAAERAFGALPRWTAPQRNHPMRSLGRAASPVVFTSEDSP